MLKEQESNMRKSLVLTQFSEEIGVLFLLRGFPLLMAP